VHSSSDDVEYSILNGGSAVRPAATSKRSGSDSALISQLSSRAIPRYLEWAERFAEQAERQEDLAERVLQQLMRSRELLARTARYYHTGMI